MASRTTCTPWPTHLPVDDLVVYAPAWERAAEPHPEFDAAQPFPVYRHPTSLMLPTPDVARRAAEILRTERCEAVWFGASAPLALLTPHLRRAGAIRVLASTHGHEVGWSMLPAARQALRRIGSTVDVLTFVSRYTRSRFSAAFGPHGRAGVPAARCGRRTVPARSGGARGDPRALRPR